METSVFSYRNFLLNDNRTTVSLFYSTTTSGGEQFDLCESFTFGQPLPDISETWALLRALHLACGVSYYKTFFNPVIAQPYEFDQDEADFWNSVFRGGLGEFLYINKLDPARLARFSVQDGIQAPALGHAKLEPRALLGIGGGKDSIVAGELLKQIGVQLEGFVMATGEVAGQAAQVAECMQVPLHRIARVLDTTLLTLQKRPDTYSGHIPISLIFALVGSLSAVSQQSQYVVVANEDSASIPQAEWSGAAVNHQWSKSFEFEQRLQAYLHACVSPNMHYFSAIRPLSSIAVAKLFSRLPKYFTVFTSDNYVFRINAADRPNARWSQDSPKSLSSYILFSAWLPKDTLLHIFGQDFLDVPTLETLFLRLLGAQGEPVLDCVGTPTELRDSLQAAYRQDVCTDSYLMQVAIKNNLISPQGSSDLSDHVSLRQSQAFPSDLQLQLLKAIQSQLQEQQ